MGSIEDFVATKLKQLGLRDDEETCSFVTGIVQEDSFEPEDKKIAILGMLEAEDDEATEASVEQLVQEAGTLRAQQLEQERIQEEERRAQARDKESAAPTPTVLTPEQEAARRAELVKTYGFVEEEDEEARLLQQAQADSDNPALALLSGDKPFVDPRYLSRKQKKKAEQGVDILMQPNLNAAIVKAAEQHKRREAAAGAAAKKDKDKADMKKQKEDAARKLAEKQKKAQKGERRA
ncbi:hypothetical protein ACM66B_001155 [Microbotryomycetes sp. NB124-2]